MARQKPPPNATERIDLRLPPGLLAQARAAAFAAKEPLSELVRRAVATEIGRPELAATMPRGRPKSA